MTSEGAHDMLVDGKVVTSSSVLVDEEHYPWCGRDAYKPLTPTTRVETQPSAQPLHPRGDASPPSSNDMVEPTFANHSEITSRQPNRCTLLDLFSGSYHRTDGLAQRMRSYG